MNRPDNDDWLDKVLSGDGGHIDDNGFSDTVMQRLPARKPRRLWLPAAILAAAVLLSGVTLLWSLPALYADLATLIYSQSWLALGLLSAALTTGSALITAWLLALFGNAE